MNEDGHHDHEAGKNAIAIIHPAGRVPFPRGFGTVVLAIVVAVLCLILVILIVHSSNADKQRLQLACQVEHLGGQPVGTVSCPPSPSPKPGKTPHPSKTSSPATSPRAVGSGRPTTVIVMVPGPTPHVIYSTRTVFVTPSSRPTSSSHASPSPHPSASPTRGCPIPVPLLCPKQRLR